MLFIIYDGLIQFEASLDAFVCFGIELRDKDFSGKFSEGYDVIFDERRKLKIQDEWIFMLEVFFVVGIRPE